VGETGDAVSEMSVIFSACEAIRGAYGREEVSRLSLTELSRNRPRNFNIYSIMTTKEKGTKIAQPSATVCLMAATLKIHINRYGIKMMLLYLYFYLLFIIVLCDNLRCFLLLSTVARPLEVLIVRL
jgi:hypothetical protein